MKFRKFLILAGKKFSAAMQAFISWVLSDGGIVEAKKYVDGIFKTATNASILQIPSAYKAGVLYNQIPLPSAELVTNGDFATDSDWTKEASWTIGGGVATYDGINDAVKIGESNIVLQEDILINTSYILTFTISNASTFATIWFLSFNGGISYIPKNDYVNGTYSIRFTTPSNISGGGIAFFAYTTGSAFDLENVSVKQVQDFTVARASDVTRTNEQGVLEVLGNNVPCIDYSDGFPVLLTQPQSTNLVTYSEDFSQAYWTKGRSSIISNETISPDGTLNADKWLISSDTGSHYIRIGATRTGDFVFSCFIKKGNYRYGGLFNKGLGIAFDFDTETIIRNDNNGNVLSIGGGWYRLSISATYAAEFSYTTVYYSDNVGGEETASDGSEYFYIWGAQLEELSYPTSYIPTSGATATRLEDLVTGAGSTSSINSEEGVLYVDMAALANGGVGDRIIGISDGTSQNSVSIIIHNTANRILCGFTVGGVPQASIAFIDKPQTVLQSIAFKWKSNDFALYIDGVEVGTDNAGIVPSANTFNKINFSSFNGLSSLFYGKTKQLRVYSSIADAQIDLPYIT